MASDASHVLLGLAEATLTCATHLGALVNEHPMPYDTCDWSLCGDLAHDLWRISSTLRALAKREPPWPTRPSS